MTDNRPNPDELLNQIEAETLTTTRGKLKIFFGSSAGVGKTYDMLMAARQAQAQGFNVLVGIVETHGIVSNPGVDTVERRLHARDTVLSTALGHCPAHRRPVLHDVHVFDRS